MPLGSDGELSDGVVVGGLGSVKGESAVDLKRLAGFVS